MNNFFFVLFLQRGGAYAVLIGGCSLGAYLIQWTLGNLKDLILNNNQWVIGYFVVAGEFLKCKAFRVLVHSQNFNP